MALVQVILNEDVHALGEAGDIVSVKPGYARNYLLPRGKALRANKDNLARFEAQKAELEARNAEARKAAEGVASGMEGVSITLIRQASETGHLYGSVSARDIAAAVNERGYTITHNQVVLDRPIKTLGVFDVAVHLHAEVEVPVSVNVARSEQEAEAQLTGEEPSPEDIFETEELAAQAEEELAEAEEELAEEEVEAEAEAAGEEEAAVEAAAEPEAEIEAEVDAETKE